VGVIEVREEEREGDGEREGEGKIL